jgi:hypothetical protein
MHGSRGAVAVGRHELTLERLAAWSSLEETRRPSEAELNDPEWVIDLTGKVLYLGSCASLHVSQGRLRGLRESTGAKAVCGYTKHVDWFAAGGFDVMLLSALARAMDRERQDPAGAVKRLRRSAGDLLDSLGFRCEPDWRPNTK